MQHSNLGPKLFQEAEHAARHGDRERAYKLMCRVLIDNPSYVPAWLWMSKLVDDCSRQRECLERALAIDPQNSVAREGLEILRLKQLLASTQSLVLKEHSPAPLQIGAYLVQQHHITAEQLEASLSEQRTRRRRGEFVQLGDILLQRGCLTPRVLAHALVAQQREKLKQRNRASAQFLGEYLLQEGIISPLQLEAALEEQIRLRLAGKRVPLGNILINKHYLTPQALQKILDRQQAEFNSSMGD
jgi:hypothetical protein